MINLLKSPNSDPALRKLDHFVEVFILAGILSIILLVCCSCSSTKAVTQLVRDVRVDTVYLSNIQYDSIYISKEKDREYRKALPNLNSLSPDTIFIRDVSVEYRYKLLKDTVKVIQCDSIPYEVTVTEVKEITRPLTWFDHTCRACFWICFGGLLITLLCLLKGFRMRNS